MTIVLLCAALLPVVVLLVYVFRKDKAEKEPIGLIARVFFLGALAGPLAAIVENIAFGLFESVIPPGLLLSILEFFVGVAAVEEAFKYLALSTVRKNPAFNYVFDGVVYGVAAALGFAALENVLYVLDGGLEVAMVRAIFSVPGHCADGVVMGCFFGLARQRELAGNKAGARTYYWLAFLLPVLEHGFYDWGLSSENDLLVLLALVVEIAFVIYAIVLVNRVSKTDAAFATSSGAQPAASAAPTAPVASVAPATPAQPAAPVAPATPAQPAAPVAPTATASPSSWTCARCGHANAGNFCGECGAPRPS